MERVGGIEPPYRAWKAPSLPLTYTRIYKNPIVRFEPEVNLYLGPHTPTKPAGRLDLDTELGFINLMVP